MFLRLPLNSASPAESGAAPASRPRNREQSAFSRSGFLPRSRFHSMLGIARRMRSFFAFAPGGRAVMRGRMSAIALSFTDRLPAHKGVARRFSFGNSDECGERFASPNGESLIQRVVRHA